MKEAARRARGDVFASIVCPLITRRAAPTQHIRHTSLFLESYIIPRMLKNKDIVAKNEKNATGFTYNSDTYYLFTKKIYIIFLNFLLWVSLVLLVVLYDYI